MLRWLWWGVLEGDADTDLEVEAYGEGVTDVHIHGERLEVEDEAVVEDDFGARAELEVEEVCGGAPAEEGGTVADGDDGVAHLCEGCDVEGPVGDDLDVPPELGTDLEGEPVVAESFLGGDSEGGAAGASHEVDAKELGHFELCVGILDADGGSEAKVEFQGSGAISDDVLCIGGRGKAKQA